MIVSYNFYTLPHILTMNHPALYNFKHKKAPSQREDAFHNW